MPEDIDDLIERLFKMGIPAVVLVKAHSGYSVVPFTKSEYANSVLLKKHYHAKSVVEAMSKLIEERLIC